jgi:hypothetical protein
MRLRWIALAGAIAAFVGFFLVFLPIIQNPILWGVPTTVPAPAYVPFGLVLFFVGSAIMFYCLFVFTWRSRNTHPSRGATSMAIYKLSYKPALAGVLAFLAVRVATHIIFPNPPSPIKLGPLLDTGTLFLCAIVSFSVSYYLIRYYDRLPFTNPIMKSIILSTLALVILGALSALAAGNSFYFMVYLFYGAADFTATGVVVGFVYARTYGPQSPVALVVSQAKKKRTWMYYLPILAVVGLVVVYGFYQDSLQPVSFKVSDIHFNVTYGSIQVVANVTNTSGPSIIQVDAAIDGVDAGVCGYGINTNRTMNCRFQIIPLPTCSQLPPTGNHTLTLSPYFGNGKMPTNSYSFTTAQLGCS